MTVSVEGGTTFTRTERVDGSAREVAESVLPECMAALTTQGVAPDPSVCTVVTELEITAPKDVPFKDQIRNAPDMRDPDDAPAAAAARTRKYKNWSQTVKAPWPHPWGFVQKGSFQYDGKYLWSGYHHCGSEWGIGFYVDVNSCYRTTTPPKYQYVSNYVVAKVTYVYKGNPAAVSHTGVAKTWVGGTVQLSETF